jgi:hypothetical protein
MNDFVSSLKNDLTDRRLVPLVGLAVAALVAALAYVVLGGGSGKALPASSVPPAAASASVQGIGVTAADDTAEKNVAETTDGVHDQRHGNVRNPFTALPSPAATEETTGSASSTSSSSSSSGSGSGGSSSGSSGSSGSGGSSSEEPLKTSAKSKATIKIFHVTVLFGSAEPNPLTGEVELTPHVNLKLFTPLPSSKLSLIVYRGVALNGAEAGQAAVFSVVGEAILSGEGKCLPSPVSCLALEIKPGQKEKIEYLPEGASTAVAYELRMVAIKTSKTTITDAEKANSIGTSAAGEAALHKAHRLSLPGLRDVSGLAGVFAPAPHSASSARAHSSAKRARR